MELDTAVNQYHPGQRFDIRNLPSVREYIAHHLAARLEQEIFRCAIRNPLCHEKITVSLFAPPVDVLDILVDRFQAKVVYDEKVPDCIQKRKALAQNYENGLTAFSRLAKFLQNWEGNSTRTAELRDQLQISPAVWKDLMQDERVRDMFEEYGVHRSGRGGSAKLEKEGDQCA
ncbi:hypothetical protein SDC9_158786 [bioreactor metagenome]|uniref:Uncharacterized protein n=1 Tax=bioreactor metagenome TaxID=1076179 RepID=A0A645FGR3_9ZZZZ